MNSKRKRESFSVEEKYEIIKLVEKKVPYNDIMKKFPKIKNPANISVIVKMKEKINKEYEEGISHKKSH